MPGWGTVELSEYHCCGRYLLLQCARRTVLADSVLGYRPIDWTFESLDSSRIVVCPQIRLLRRSLPLNEADLFTRPDNCDGTFQSFCDASRQYTGIASTLQANGQTALLDYMKIYWKDANGNDESFWEHEWGKHGTCISTLDTKCYTGYTPEEELIDYLNITVSLFKQLDSYAVRSHPPKPIPTSKLTKTTSSSPQPTFSPPPPKPTPPAPSSPP